MSKIKKLLLTIFLLIFSVGAFGVGYVKGKENSVFELRKQPQNNTFVNRQDKHAEKDFSLFWEVWDRITKDYLMRPVDPQKMMDSAIKGMTDYQNLKESTKSSESNE